MSEQYTPISDHNARVFKLNEMDTDLNIGAPIIGDTLLLCDRLKRSKTMTRLVINADKFGNGFSTVREDGNPIQAQDVRYSDNLPPYGRPIFEEPIDTLPITRDVESGQWKIDVDPDNVVDTDGLRVLVWTLAHYGLEKKNRLPSQPQLLEV